MNSETGAKGNGERQRRHCSGIVISVDDIVGRRQNFSVRHRAKPQVLKINYFN